MKKIALVFGICFLIAIFYFLYPSSSPHKKENNGRPQPAQNEKASVRKSLGRKPTEPAATDSDWARLKAALKEENHYNVQILVQKLSDDLKEHPENIDEILRLLKSETDQALLTYLTQIIEGGGVLGNKLVIETAVELAERDIVPARRHAALALLGKVQDITPELSQSISRLAREAGDNQIRNSAIATLASWMSSRPEMAAALNQELLQAINSSNNVEVRGNALQVLALHLPQLPDNFTSAAADYLKTDPSPFNRAMAARALGEANDQMKEFALQELEQSYSREESLETKRAILSAIVRAGTTNSPTILQRLPASAPLAGDITEYLNILQAGVIDRDEIQRQKSVRHAEKESPALGEKH